MSDKFVVSTNTVGEIIVTDVETGNVYRYDNLYKRQNNEIKLLRKKIIELREDLEKIPLSIREMWFDE